MTHENFIQMLFSWLEVYGITGPLAILVLGFMGAIMIALLSVTANAVAKTYLMQMLEFIVTRSKNKWDDLLLHNKVFLRLSHLAPALVIYLSAAMIFSENSTNPLAILMRRGSVVYMMVISALVISAILNTFETFYNEFEVSKERPIRGYVQASKLIIYLCVIVLSVASMTNTSPLYFLSGMGALTAVLVLVFKEPIMGFVAGIQLSSNRMVKTGDWISMPKYGADGDVIEVSLTTIKVQNWDKTITYIPIYALVNDSFTNWRGMSESGGRRIKRAIRIDMSTVKFSDPQMMEEWEKITILQPYLARKRKEIEAFNASLNGAETASPVNGRRLTNLGTFRAYVDAYLRNKSEIHKEMSLIVRHLEPGSEGVPIEIYCFVNNTNWSFYEAVQADIFDHILAIMPVFGLRIFQNPTGNDWKFATAKSEEAVEVRGQVTKKLP